MLTRMSRYSTFFIIATLIQSCTHATEKHVKKDFINPQELLRDSFLLAKKIFDSGFKPDVLIALWRGGSPIGIAITEYFSYKGEAIENHGAVRTSYYNHNQRKATVQIIGLECIIDHIKVGDKVLIVDEVIDSGVTMQQFLQNLHEKCDGKLATNDVKIAVVYHKPHNACLKPDYYIHETNDWLVFPHELEGTSNKEISIHRGAEIAHMLQ